jgi:hypothetical protein
MTLTLSRPATLQDATSTLDKVISTGAGLMLAPRHG